MTKVNFIDPLKEYSKPESIEIKINGGSKFLVVESVFLNIMKTLGFRRDSVIVEKDFVIYNFVKKFSRKDDD